MSDTPYWLCCGSTDHWKHKSGCNEREMGNTYRCKFGTAEEHRTMNTSNINDFEEGYRAGYKFCVELYESNSANTVSNKEMIVFLMDEIDKASQWLVEGQTHMAIGVLGQCHAEIRKHLSK
jgi:hypothetical protein